MVLKKVREFMFLTILLIIWLAKLATLGLASDVFSPWMNVSDSLLANFWLKKEIRKKRKYQNLGD
ncbi:MAG: hypothetical protein H7Y10_15605 [Flavobacterium sp.]|nr:hypothetical protein [Flavobacterium sp.]